MSTKVKIIEGEGITRTTNPLKKVDGQPAVPSFDYLGRQITYPYQIRGLISTGSANLSLIAETTIISGIASTLLDLVYVTGSNTSVNAIRVDLRYGTNGSVIDSMVIPVGSTTEKQYRIPYPMSEVAQSITAKLNQAGEISDSPITITALAIQNV